MLSDHDEAFAGAAFAPVRDIEPDEALVARVVARTSRRKKASPRFALAPARPRFALQALAALALLGAALYSVPVTRAAIEGTGESVGGVFSGWLGGDSAEAPGKPLEAGEKLLEYQEYLHDTKEPRVVAEAGRYKLYSYIGVSGGLGFEFGGIGVGLGNESAAELGDAPLHLLDPGAMPHADAQGHVPLFGLAARSVSSVELTYESGPPLRVSGVDGGFVLLAEPSRGPIEVIALDAGGREIGREPIDYPLVDESPEAPPPGIERSGHASSGSHEP
ncbi:MAG TPA: hypothetical protein VGN84_11305 [Solirubrobacterales bacterium]|jgi:hypothetical protein|nr:hypothetical protein [Solirubrobacterales bacterium]